MASIGVDNIKIHPSEALATKANTPYFCISCKNQDANAAELDMAYSQLTPYFSI
jgi:hypothetical protein